ncbi:TonB-dependent receptor plug domain-containing protein [Aliikangiella sp. IMCC44359]|uniref:TonB-dependent receptor plug domain-containing protein n=1 Tax=Aliikangiella sp. IMCC44359 TaxID=3459125 RepID=UPI00403ADCCD
MANNFKKRSLFLAMGIALSSPMLYAAEEKKDDDEEAQKMVIVGSRAAPRSISDSPVPVDVISAEEITASGSSDLTSLLANVAPSFTVNEQPISDAATLVRPANLRGLSPDSTLILVNGKRRHRSAVITFIGGGIADGSQGPDISAIPATALKQVEVLRDGASAQYGSDAIAGVINFVLKDSSDGGEFIARMGEFSEGDGDSVMLSGNVGMPFTEQGFANFSFEYNDREDTIRSVQRDDAAALIAAGNTNVANPAQIWGMPKVKDDYKLFANIGLNLGNDKEAYMWGNYSQREVDGGFYFRNPQTRSGVFQGPTLPDGTATILTADLTPGATDNSACPVVPVVNGLVDQTALDSLAAANCFAFNSLFPGGFTPRFGGTVVDTSLVMGTKGSYDSGLTYDISVGLGRSAVDFSIRNTINPSLGPNTPTAFNPGSYIQLEKSFNYDISKEIETSSMDGMTFSAGVEWREDSFEVKPGDQASFEVGPLAGQGFGIGSNGFPGFQPRAAGVFTRRNIGFYADLETYFTESLMMEFAVRYEDFSDFGSTFDGKISGHFQATDVFAIRGSASTGFRAPTVGQSNVVNVTTAFGANGLEDQATLPPTNAISVQKGGKPLTPEESTAFTVGAVLDFDDLFITLDFFNIEVDDRISQTSPLTLSAADITELVNQGVGDATSFTSVRYFTNDFDTTTAGVDLVVSYSADMFGGKTSYNLALNHTETTVDSFSPDIISNVKVELLEKGVPEDRATFTMKHTQDNWNLLTRISYFGEYFEDHLESEAFPVYPSSEISLDLEFGYNVTEQLKLSLGANNLLDEYPEQLDDKYSPASQPSSYAGVAGAKYAIKSPLGFNGRFVYLKANYTF